MPNTYTQIYIHVIFPVARRECLIAKRHQEEVNKFITGIIRNKNHKLLAIGWMPDHLHTLIGMRPTSPCLTSCEMSNQARAFG